LYKALVGCYSPKVSCCTSLTRTIIIRGFYRDLRLAVYGTIVKLLRRVRDKALTVEMAQYTPE
jgi:hypothetical protein